MSRSVVPFLLLTFLFALPSAAQNADLTVRLTPEPFYNAGEIATVRATVTNHGPDPAMAAGVRLSKPSQRFVGASRFGCIEFPDAVLCNTATLSPGQSRDFLVPFSPPDVAGEVSLYARTESFTADPHHENDAASATVNIVSLMDLDVSVSLSPSLRPEKTSRVFVRVGNKAARRPESVTLLVTLPEPLVLAENDPPCQGVDGSPGTVRCTIPNFSRDNQASVYFDVLVARAGPPATITASIDSPEPDWNPVDNQASLSEPVFEVYDLDVRIASPDTPDANNRTTAEFSLTNTRDVPATGVTAEIITFPGEADPASATGGWRCVPSSPYRLVCTNAFIPPHTTSVLRLPVRFAAPELRVSLAANVTQKPTPEFMMYPQSVLMDAVFYRPFRVTNASDGGAGSLRQAILDANAACSSDDANPPCSIRFELPSPVPAEGWYTIAPHTPLPRLTVTDLLIDGEAQTALTGNTNPAGPEIFLSGGEAGEADGLDLNSSSAVVRGLAIGGFARNGILSITRPLAFVARHQIIQNNDLGTDPTGSTAVPNGLRGLMAYGFAGEITGNVMSGNRRSGVFLTDSVDARIRDNRIGVAAASDQPLGNGASGIYIGNGHALIEHNVIANGNDSGVAIARSANAEVLENRIFNNVQPGIDLGLDGPSLDGVPRITTVRFDPAAGETIVEGVIPQQPILIASRTVTAYVYANTRDEAGGEFFLGAVRADAKGRFALRYRGDLSGRYIDAMNVQVTDFGDLVVRESSEFGPRTRM